MSRQILHSFVFGGVVLGAALMGARASARTQTVTAADLEISAAWVREASAAQESTGAYLVITNNGMHATALVAVKTVAAKHAEVHEMTTTDHTAMSGMDGGMMTMKKFDRIALPARGKVELKPGGYHIMLVGLAKPLRVGDTISLDLTFEGGASKTVIARVLSRAATTYQP